MPGPHTPLYLEAYMMKIQKPNKRSDDKLGEACDRVQWRLIDEREEVTKLRNYMNNRLEPSKSNL